MRVYNRSSSAGPDWFVSKTAAMSARAFFILFVSVLALTALACRGSSPQPVSRADVENGARLFVAGCATCHGVNGDTVRGVELLDGQFKRASTDEQLVTIITQGIPGTSMPPSNYSALEARMIIAYMRGVAGGDEINVTPGDVARGKALFEGEAGCASCHHVESRMASSLADVGALRRPLELQQFILDASAAPQPSLRSVRAVTMSGAVIPGRLLNQSTFSVQMLDSSQTLRAFDRTDLREFMIYEASAMPSYREKLDSQEVADLVTYLTTLRGGGSGDEQVTFDRIVRAPAEPHNWLTYSGDLQGHRHSLLTQITPGNIRSLELAWAFQALSVEKFEATPLVIDGVLYTVQPPNDVVAIDAASGRIFWTYSYSPSMQARPCCGRLNRGLAILGDSLFMGTVDGRLLALDAKTGRERWNVVVAGARPEAGYSFTLAPLVVKDKIIAGPAGGEFGIRGFIAAFDPATGNELWRFYTIPGPGEKGHETWTGDSWRQGGGSIWTTGTYDPELNLTFWGTGNPAPVFTGDDRSGDNLYSNSLLALDPDTGALKWHFQFTPHDEFDYDATQVPVLAEIEYSGQRRKVVLLANRNGFFYVLDRTNGEFLFARPFSKVTWTTGLDAKGRPQNMVKPTSQGTVVYPHLAGATNWYSPSFNPKTGLCTLPRGCSRRRSSAGVQRNTLKAALSWEPFQRRTDWGSTARK